jgi:NADH:ubiquinone oxidoreductase subunit 4 (subunit M)
MEMATLLNVVTFLPLVGAVISIMIPRSEEKLVRAWALLVTIVTFLTSIPLFYYFDGSISGMQFETVKTGLPIMWVLTVLAFCCTC